ncbi:MAG: TlpA family protein disulfide reductase [Actinobacteria bacterium]|nr:TlpA family protein disulfide reductase [Actinomycetota bacterium]
MPGLIDESPPSSGWFSRWRFGMLTLLAMAVVLVGIVLFDGGSGADEPTTTAAAASITIPPMPATTEAPENAAPDFSLALMGGGSFTLSEHLAEDGRPVILNLWASWCPPCRDEMPDLNAAAVANPDVLFLGIAVSDDPVAAEEFATSIEIAYPIGFDESGRVGASFPAAGLPSTFVIAPSGEVVQMAFGRLSPANIDILVDIARQG